MASVTDSISNVSEWDIWIDDIQGELAMDKTRLAKRKVEVVSKEEMLESVEAFFHEIKHGDVEHIKWLAEKFESYFSIKINHKVTR